MDMKIALPFSAAHDKFFDFANKTSQFAKCVDKFAKYFDKQLPTWHRCSKPYKNLQFGRMTTLVTSPVHDTPFAPGCSTGKSPVI